MFRPLSWVLLLAFVAAPAWALQVSATVPVTPVAHAFGQTCRVFAGKFVQLTTKSGLTFDVYRTGPRAATLGVLLLPGKSGLNAAMLAWADRIGAQGYRVAAMGLRHKPTLNPAQSHSGSQSRSVQRERAAIHYLVAPGRKIVTLGWGRTGALLSLEASVADPFDVSGTVLYNGGLSAPVTLLKQLKSLVLLVTFHKTTPLAKLQAFEGHMRFYGKPLIVHYYDMDPKAVDPTGPDHGSAVALEVWNQARLFFHRVRTLCRRCAPYPRYLFRYH